MGSGLGKKMGSILDRMEVVESTLPQLVEGVQKVVNNLNQRQNDSDRIMMAVVDLLGKENISAKIEDMVRTEKQAECDNNKANLEKAVAEGKAVKVEKVTTDSLVVGREMTPEGIDVFPGRIQMMYTNFRPEVQDLILSKVDGEVIDTPNGGKFEVLEVYELTGLANEGAVELPAN